MLEKITISDTPIAIALCWNTKGSTTKDAFEVTCKQCIKLLAKRTAKTLGPPLTRTQLLDRVRTALRPLEHREGGTEMLQEARQIALKELRAHLPKDMEPEVKITYEPFSKMLSANITWRPKQ